MEKKMSLERLQATLHGVRLPHGPPLDRFTVTGGAGVVRIKPFEIHLSEKALIEAEVSDRSLIAFLEELAPGGLRGFQAEMVDGRIYISAKAKILVEIPVKAVCTLRIEDGRHLLVELQDVDVAGGPAKKLVEGQISKLNPIFDVADLPLRLRLTSVEVDAGRILVRGEAMPDGS